MKVKEGIIISFLMYIGLISCISEAASLPAN